ncbi:MAG: putative porin [Cyclobacteriaceae bacterium]|nr:putative porin [Cyclobacteriaceae bacterium]
MTLAKNGIILLLCFLSMGAMAQSQIVDDSTKQVYGAYTTFFRHFEDIKYNRDHLQKVDTTFGKMHRISMQEKLENKFQNLGFLGTAMRPVFYTPPTDIGIRSGYDAYTPYYITAEDIEYFDTKSPYTPLNVVIGGKGRAVTTIKHTRNINPYWNIGFHFHKINADKQVASTGKGDNHATSTAYYLHTDYQSPNGKYHGLGSISRLNHKVWEQGGIEITEGDPINSYFDEDANVRLDDARSQDFRFGIHIYNQYKLRDIFQLYQSSKFIKNKNFYKDVPLTNDLPFYDQVLINPDSTTDQSQTNQFANEFGIKGDLEKMFYSFFIKFRNVNYISNYQAGKKLYFENSGGFELRYDFDSLQNVKASGEYIIGGFYRFGGAYFNKFFTLEYWRTQSRPAIIEDSYFGNHFFWQQDLATPASDLLKGSLIYANKALRIEPFASVTNVKNNIYYGYDKAPAQAEGSAQLLNIGLDLDFSFFKTIFWENEVIYTRVTGEQEAVNSFRIPEVFVNATLYYGSYWFVDKIYVKIGVDAHYKSAYFAPAYNPVLQQFYLQDDFLIPSYTVLDVFVEFQIDQLTAFLKMEHVNQSRASGYFTYPYYIGQPRVFDIGVRWIFFD